MNEADLLWNSALFLRENRNVYLCGLKEDKEYNHVRALNAVLNRFNKVNLDFM